MADRVEITVLVENYIDIFLPSTPVTRYPVPGKESELWAEQGLSLWIEAFEGGETIRVLYDFGRSDRVFFHNLKILGLDLESLDSLVLSHGHVDHWGSLQKVLRKTPGECRLMVHPEATRKTRYIRLADGSYVGPWKIRRSLVEEFGSRIRADAHPTHLGMGVYTSGEIERRTSFELGMPNAFVKVKTEKVHDEIEDDQCLFIDLKGKGVIVITGCCHAGVVNTLLSCQKIFPGKNVYALIGGFHLNSAEETQMKKTLDFLSELNLKHICGIHCTGHQVQKLLMERFKKEWITNTVGAKMIFKREG